MVRKSNALVANNDVKQLLLETVNENFFLKNYIRINRAVSTYSALKLAYKDKERGVEFYEGFRDAFFRFYGIGRFVSEKFRNTYYQKMLDLRSETDYDVKRLVEDLKDEEKNKIQFSFTTKLLNIINDEKYAIYDSYVVAVFKLPAAYGSVDKYVECYEIINKTYIEMLADDRIQCLIGDFRKIFIQSDNLSDMRIIDIIVWKIGEDKKK